MTDKSESDTMASPDDEVVMEAVTSLELEDQPVDHGDIHAAPLGEEEGEGDTADAAFYARRGSSNPAKGTTSSPSFTWTNARTHTHTHTHSVLGHCDSAGRLGRDSPVRAREAHRRL